MMHDYAIYLDLDGVLADYDAGIRKLGFNPDPAKKNELNRSGSKDPFKRTMYEAIRGTDFYRYLPIMPGSLDLLRAVSDAGPIILTAAPKFGATENDYFLNPHWLGAAYHKRVWVEERLLPEAFPNRVRGFAPGGWRDSVPDRIAIPDERFICTTSARKQEFIGRKHSEHQLLIDDRRDNCIRWAAAGGAAILHTDPKFTLHFLEGYQNENIRRAAFTLVPGGGLIAGLTDIRTHAEMEA